MCRCKSGRKLVQIAERAARVDGDKVDKQLHHAAGLFIIGKNLVGASVEPVRAGDRRQLCSAGAAGATLLETVHKPGFDMVMLRDPFGMAIQFVKRGTPILT